MSGQKKSKWWKWLLAILVIIVLFLILVPRKAVLSETELNQKLSANLSENMATANNPLLAASVDLEEGKALLSLQWQAGQTLTADILVADDQVRLIARNVDIEGAGIFDEVFEGGFANLVLNNILTTISLSQKRLVKIEIKKDQLIGYYR